MKMSISKTEYIVLIMFCSAILFSCKKGENDPFLSLRSRKARIVGEWKLQKGFEKNTGEYKETIIYTETTVSKTDELGTENFTYSMEYVFKNDGSYSSSYTETPVSGNPTIQKAEGRWMFMDKNKPGKVKSKECILLTQTNFSYSRDGDNFSNTDSNPTDGILFYINQLENKLMVVKATSNSSQTGGGNTTTGTFEMEYTFIAK